VQVLLRVFFLVVRLDAARLSNLAPVIDAVVVHQAIAEIGVD
jgi:hypothetical protein